MCLPPANARIWPNPLLYSAVYHRYSLKSFQLCKSAQAYRYRKYFEHIVARFQGDSSCLTIDNIKPELCPNSAPLYNPSLYNMRVASLRVASLRVASCESASCESASCESASCESASCESASCESASCESASLRVELRVCELQVCESEIEHFNKQI